MRLWIRIIAALLAAALLLWLGWGLVRTAVNVISGAHFDAAEPDPMFAEEAELPTRPPELDDEGEVPDRPTLDDQEFSGGAPVDKTAQQLIEEAKQKFDS